MKLMRMLAVMAVATALTLGATSCKDEAMAPTTLANMGGMDGLSKLMTNWTAAMAAVPALGSALSADDMTMVTKGFVNEVAKASKIPLPNEGVDLVQVLKGKSVSAENLTAMGEALKSAAGTTQLSPDATTAAMGLWDGVANKAK